jgi:putative transposase
LRFYTVAFDKKLKLAKSSYYYQKKRVSFAKKHKDDYQAVATMFHNNKERYGYRRIKIVLKPRGLYPIRKGDTSNYA